MAPSFEELVKKVCTAYFAPSQQEMKKVFNDVGIVNDVFNEIVKYLIKHLPKGTDVCEQIFNNKSVSHWDFCKVYFTYRPFNYNNFLRCFREGLCIYDNIPEYLLPGIKKILKHEETYDFYGHKCIRGYQIYIYEKYVITYNFNDSDDMEDFDNFEGFKDFVGEEIKVYAIEEFDFKTYIEENKIKDIEQICKILHICDPDSFDKNILELCSVYKI
jgi:hypothetical protein